MSLNLQYALGLSVGYGKDLKSYSPDDPLILKMETLKRVPLSPFEEAKIAAREIADKFGTTPWVCLSGGLDSEATAYAFLKAGVEFKVVTMQFENGLNDHEIKFAKDFCKQHGIVQELIPVQIIDFLETQKFVHYFHKYNAQSVEVCAQLHFLDQFSEPFVWSGEPMRVFRIDDGVKLQAISDFEQMIYRYAVDKNRLSVPNFHYYSSELAFSFLRLSFSTRNDYFEDDHKPEYYRQKYFFYKSGGFELAENNENRVKAHGFEKVKIYLDGRYSGTSRTDYNANFRIPWKDQYMTQKHCLVEIPKDDLIAKSILNFK